MSKPRLIAFYLPQFYPTPENDEWWGKGFTEWTNVGRARPLFNGHYQPRVPADLGYYDLRIPEIREQQVELAREAGIEGFCYWHYWFNGRRLLDRVFTEVVESGTPDFPFCLCWANHSWYAKTWDPKKPDTLLIEQTYGGVEDYKSHFYAMLPAFKDKRYIKVNGKLVFGIFHYQGFSDARTFMDTWQQLALANGLDGFYFFGMDPSAKNDESYKEILKFGYDSAVVDYGTKLYHLDGGIGGFVKKLKRKFFHIPKYITYDDYCRAETTSYKCAINNHPVIVPNFDHSPRSAHRGLVLDKSTPERWGVFCKTVFDIVKNRPQEVNLVFIKSWNEWGEGNYLEPDIKYGHKYLVELRSAYDCVL